MVAAAANAVNLRRRQIGRTGAEVTVVGFGGAAIGNLYSAVPDEIAQATIDAAWDAGIRYFDTAPHYGLGLSERRLGQGLTGRSRSEYTVSTKVGRVLVPNTNPTGSDLAAGGFDVPDTLRREFDFSRDGVRRSIDASLQRLRLDRVDIAFVHDPDAHLDQAVEHTLPALAELRDEGVVGAIGVGMVEWQPLLHLVRAAPLDVVMLAGRWTLVDRSGGALLDECARRNVSVLAAAPYNSGLLARDWPADRSLFDYASAPAALIAQARSHARAAAEYGVTLPQLAMQFPLRHPAAAAVVVGMRTPSEAGEAVKRAVAPVPPAVWGRVDA